MSIQIQIELVGNHDVELDAIEPCVVERCDDGTTNVRHDYIVYYNNATLGNQIVDAIAGIADSVIRRELTTTHIVR